MARKSPLEVCSFLLADEEGFQQRPLNRFERLVRLFQCTARVLRSGVGFGKANKRYRKIRLDSEEVKPD